MLTLMLVGILTLAFNFSLRRISVNIAERSCGNMARWATHEGDGKGQLFSSSPYERTWDFGRASEWGDFANVKDNSMEIVIGIDYAKPDSYERLRRFITKNQGEFVDTVSMNGKSVAVVADVPIAKIAAFSEEVKAAGFSRYIEPNLKFQASFIPNDPDWPQQWGTAKIEADWAWDTTIGDSSVLVAVIDTGVDWNHSDLAGNYDASGYDWVNMDDDPMDDSGHGTHCAGIIGAVINNGLGVAGLAQVRVMAEKGLDQFGVGYADELANAIVHATNQSAHIISMSWGGSYNSELVYEALKYAYDSGVLLIASAGNEATDRKVYPAAYKEVIAVTATDQNDDPASFTNYGDWVEVAAPGVDIYSTIRDDSYASKSGTSMSAAHVSGVAALIWSQFPNVTRDWVRAQLSYTADDLGDPGFDEYYGYGKINARLAVEQAPPDHDLLIFDLEIPQFLLLNDATIVSTAVFNYGSTNESSVAIQLLVNGSLVDSTVISFIESGVLVNVDFVWTPTTEGIYNVTAHVVPVLNETITQNNALSKHVAVRTLRVPEKYPTIQEAINVALGGETIFVSSGVYLENVIVNKTVSLIGENKSNTLIDGNGTGNVVEVVAHYVNVGGFTIQNGDFAGVAVYSDDSIIADNTIRANNENGLLLNSRSPSNTVSNNTMMNNTNGILIESVWYGSYICGNIVMNNTNGIVFRESMHLTLRGNKMSGNFYNLMVEPAWLITPPDEYEYFHDIDTSNTVDGKPVYYWINEHDKQVPTDAGYVALINCKRITVENLTLTRNSQGVLLALTINSTIRNVNASNNFWCGISLEFYSNGNSVIRNTVDHTNESGYAGILLAWYSDHNEIVNNTVTCGANGIVIRLNSSENQIIGNTVSDNKWTGIRVWSSDNVLRCNNMTNNTYNFELGSFIQDIDTSNTVNGKPIYYWVNQHDKQVPPDAGYIAIINSTGITVENLNLANNCEGVLIAYSSRTLIESVNISTVDYGIRIYSSHHNNVSVSTILNSGEGISLEFSNNNAITDTAILNSSFGVFLDESSDNLISGNTLAASYSDIYIATSHNNRICQNKISNSRNGISIGQGSQNNTIETNLITNNYIGISVYDSYNNTIICNTIMLNSYYGIYFCRSNNNVIYHNNFIDNTGQVFYREGNIFDNGYPSGGNYWSDYAGVDEKSGPNQDQPGSDGIGDTPYTLFPYGEDRYPLMKPREMHDIAITNLTFSTENPKINELLHIYVTVQNRGNSTETFNVSVNYTRVWDPLIGTQTITLEPGAIVTLNFTWTPTTGGRHEIKAYTSTIPNDMNPSDNTKTSYVYVRRRGRGGAGRWALLL